MPDSSSTDFATFGAMALDLYQEIFEGAQGLDHRTNDDHAGSLLGDLLADLMHYADARGISFDTALEMARSDHAAERSQPGQHLIGSPVQLIGLDAAEREFADLPIRGQVTGILTPPDGPTTCYVRFPLEMNGHAFTEDKLRPAPPFPPTITSAGVVESPLAAEAALVETIARIESADNPGSAPRFEDIRDHQALLATLSSWVGMDEQRTSELIEPKVFDRIRQLETGPGLGSSPALDVGRHQTVDELSTRRSAPAQLAAENFPLHDEGAQPGSSAEVDRHSSPPFTTNRPTTPPGPVR
ncbi:hypothetical protein SMC26_24050 [Actinomadura fulvescens]|uniref:Uncharacterized protein n=1 Tax=Actinomadura fulvescens TaxID=46160 RepID=A0ABN3Q4X6_9ACTN